MAREQKTLEETIAMARRLDPSERMKLRQALDRMTAKPAEEEKPSVAAVVFKSTLDQITESLGADDREMIFKRAMLEKGMVSEIRPSWKVPDSARRHPIPVKGKPVSETIIEDRG